jgi:hypothetical protein
MEYGQQMKQAKDNALVGLYQNPGYQFERREKKNLLIDYKIGLTITDINLPLFEPLKIDKLSDVYIESFTTFHALANTNVEKVAFVIDINELNINTSTNLYSTGTTTTNNFNKIVIPNEEGTAGARTKVHKGRKLNYVCTLNPSTISSLTIKITDLNNSTPATMFGDATGRILFELMIVARD